MGTPYENQILGAFVYALGVESGKQGKFLPVNLFQQTPLDGTFGDLVAGADWCLAFEFKREKATVESEVAKWSEAGLQAFKNDKRLMVASSRAHVLCFSCPAMDGIDLFYCSYSSALGLTKFVERSCNNLITGLVRLAGDPDGIKKIGLPPAQLEAYLRKLASFRKQGAGGRESNWLSVASGSDGFKFRTSSSLIELIEPKSEVEKLLSRDIDRDHEARASRGKGFDRDR